MFPSAIFDMDGTLVDSNYHHSIAWHRAFRAYDVAVPLWQIHRHMGMGGDKLVGEVAGGGRAGARPGATRCVEGSLQ